MRTFSNILQSAIAALIVSFVAFASYYMVLRWVLVYRLSKQHGAEGFLISVNLGSLWTPSVASILMTALLLAVLVTIFRVCYRRLRSGYSIPSLITGGVFNFLMFGVVVVLLLLNLVRSETEHRTDAIQLTALASLYVASIAFYPGALLGLWLAVRSRRIHSLMRLFGESALAGLVLGNLVTLALVVDFATSWHKQGNFIAFALGIAAFCSLGGFVFAELFAIVFRRRFISAIATT